MTAIRYEYKTLVGRPDKGIFGLPRFIWEDNIKIDFADSLLGM
jgi:hypothetical protein